MASPLRPTDDDARALARNLMAKARFAALAVHDPETGAPLVSRVACAPDDTGLPMALVSDLSMHTQALKADPRCSLLLGEPGPKGDPLTHPRLSLQGQARFIRHGAPDHAALAERLVSFLPKARLYIGFADFSLLRVTPIRAHLNGGFGKAYLLSAKDLTEH